MTDDVSTIRPPCPCSTIRRAAACAVKYVPRRFVATSRSNASASISRKPTEQRQPGMAAQDVEPAERTQGRVDERAPCRRIPGIAAHEPHLATARLDRPGGLRGPASLPK